MNFSFLTQLQITTDDYIDSQTWIRTFGKLPLLERVYVQGYSARSFLEALVYKTKAAEKSKTAFRRVSFPKLRYIHLESPDLFETGLGSISVDMLLDGLVETLHKIIK